MPSCLCLAAVPRAAGVKPGTAIVPAFFGVLGNSGGVGRGRDEQPLGSVGDEHDGVELVDIGER